jgi:hypothetical protein
MRDLATALAVAAMGVVLLRAALERHLTSDARWMRFVLIALFVGVWGGGAWALAIGPRRFDVYWVALLLLTVLLGVVLAVLSPPHLRTRREVMVKERELFAGLGIFFWSLIGSLVAAVIVRYAR